ncbi:hypothetical protein ACOTJF_18145 [Achromobacter ruhlandii]|uniref:hypothetical protein n=1 Tax=Achromobacter ruhlandii TaxID=72557 RepID=UPI003BA1422B
MAINKTRLHLIELDGVQKPLRHFAQQYGIHEATLHNRLKRGMPLRAALETPVDVAQSKKNKRMTDKRWKGVQDPEWSEGKKRAYISHEAMKRRCLAPTCPEFKYYGARGITVCSRWMDFENFYADMGDRPLGTTIDRINNYCGYEPGNCRWATQAQQNENKRHKALRLDYQGKSLTVREWAKELGFDVTTLRSRLKFGHPIERVLSREPLKPNSRHRAQPAQQGAGEQ